MPPDWFVRKTVDRLTLPLAQPEGALFGSLPQSGGLVLKLMAKVMAAEPRKFYQRAEDGAFHLRARLCACARLTRSMEFESQRTIPADHPSLPGHFPGAPIVPAVVILDEVVAVVAEWRANSRLVAIPLAKFLSPLQPGQAFTICLSLANDTAGEINFRCRTEERLIAEGRLQIDRASV